MLIVNAEIDGRCGQDVRSLEGIIQEIGSDLPRHPGEDVFDARGGALLPGLSDHHLHLFALAAVESSVRCGPPEVTNEEELAAALALARQWLGARDRLPPIGCRGPDPG